MKRILTVFLAILFAAAPFVAMARTVAVFQGETVRVELFDAKCEDESILELFQVIEDAPPSMTGMDLKGVPRFAGKSTFADGRTPTLCWVPLEGRVFIIDSDQQFGGIDLSVLKEI